MYIARSKVFYRNVTKTYKYIKFEHIWTNVLKYKESEMSYVTKIKTNKRKHFPKYFPKH